MGTPQPTRPNRRAQRSRPTPIFGLKILQMAFAQAALGLEPRQDLAQKIDRSGDDDDILRTAGGAKRGPRKKGLHRRPQNRPAKSGRNQGFELLVTAGPGLLRNDQVQLTGVAGGGREQSPGAGARPAPR